MHLTLKRILFFVSAVCLMLSCGDSTLETKKPSKRHIPIVRFEALPETVKMPKDNPTSPEKEELGKLLFYDPILSGNKDVACASCHHPNYGYSEFLDISIGPNSHGLGSKRRFKQPNDIPFVKRNAQTILNTAFNGIDMYGRYEPETSEMFWDDRSHSLEKQSLEPIKAFEEMRGHGIDESEILQVIMARLKQIPKYQELFAAAFKEPNAITIDNMAKAIAAFERTLITNNSRFDRYMRGEEDAMLLSEKEGFALFKSVGCANCHLGPMFSDFKMHVLGVPENMKLPSPDMGVNDTFAFRTPSLRNLRFTAPYMHNGSLPTLRRVLEFYEDIANRKVRNEHVPVEKFDPLVRELELSVKEMSLIISFLNTLNDDSFDKSIPDAVPSGLPVGGNLD